MHLINATAQEALDLPRLSGQEAALLERPGNRELVIALAFTRLPGLLTAAAHGLVWHRDGALVRTAGEGLGIRW